MCKIYKLNSIICDPGGLQVSPSKQSSSVLHGLLLGKHEPTGALVVNIKLRSCANIIHTNIMIVIIIHFITLIYTKLLSFPSDEDQLIVTELNTYLIVIW